MPNEVLTRAIDAVCAGDHLTADHASGVLAEIMEGRASEIQTGAFLVALRAKGETVPELVGLARTMR
jgi:anthranilate phosphoribosyltransferase